jgi:integrase
VIHKLHLCNAITSNLSASSDRSSAQRSVPAVGSTRQTKALKHRADNVVRAVPLPPPLVEILCEHLNRWPANDLLFTNGAGRSVTPENYGKVWNRAKPMVWTQGHVAASAVPYDLRHTAATMMQLSTVVSDASFDWVEYRAAV